MTVGGGEGGWGVTGGDSVSLVPAGAVKVTPGHSSPDLALARAHGLPLLSVIGDDGTMCPPGGGWLQVLPFLAFFLFSCPPDRVSCLQARPCVPAQVPRLHPQLCPPPPAASLCPLRPCVPSVPAFPVVSCVSLSPSLCCVLPSPCPQLCASSLPSVPSVLCVPSVLSFVHCHFPVFPLPVPQLCPLSLPSALPVHVSLSASPVPSHFSVSSPSLCPQLCTLSLPRVPSIPMSSILSPILSSVPSFATIPSSVPYCFPIFPLSPCVLPVPNCVPMSPGHPSLRGTGEGGGCAGRARAVPRHPGPRHDTAHVQVPLSLSRPFHVSLETCVLATMGTHPKGLK